MVEASNKLLEQVLRDSPSQIGIGWDQRLPKAAGIFNSRIIDHLGYSASSILFGLSKRPQQLQLLCSPYQIVMFMLGLLS